MAAIASNITDTIVTADDEIENDYKTVKRFLSTKSRIFQELMLVQEAVKVNPKADEKYRGQKERSTSPSEKQKEYFYKMMTKIGDEMQMKEKVILPRSKTINLEVLDICMAPGGYSAAVLKHNSLATICGLSLPINEGGHDVLLPNWQRDKKVKIEFMDITMLAAEMGFPDLVTQGSPDASQFTNYIPYKSRVFDVVFCDGQVLHTHTRVGLPIQVGRTKHEPPRLTAAQLTIALHRIKRYGTLVMLLHQAYSPHIIRLLESFNQFSNISLFKPKTSHHDRSSFYLVAKNVDPKHETVSDLLHQLQISWTASTIQNFDVQLPVDSPGVNDTSKTMETIMQIFGEKLIALAEPMWDIQKKALERKFLTD